MKPALDNLDLIDLISERHVLLRGICEKAWNDRNDLYISNSEWYIMARIYKHKPTISYVSKHVDISRQATHKFIKSLAAKGLVGVTNSEHNKKDKCLYLTELGEQCYEQNELQKAALEKKIADRVGAENVKLLKELLKSDWGMDRSG